MRATLVAALAAALLLPCLVEAQPTQRSKKRKGKKGEAAGAAAWMLPDASAAPSAKELAQLFPGASAVIALDGVQHEWSTDRQVTTVQRRVRLIEGRGLEMELFVPEGSGHWSVKEGSAKLTSSSGAVRALEDPELRPVDGGLILTLSAPDAAPGDLVELVQALECAQPSYPPVAVQDGLPVAESRIVAVPPPILTLRAYGYGLPADRLEPVEFEVGELKGAGWRFESFDALRSGAFAPARETVSPRLLLAVEKYPDPATAELKEMSWPAWGALSAAAVSAWAADADFAALGKELGGAPDPAQLLDALRERLGVTRRAAWPETPSAKAALDGGSGNSADLALLLHGLLKQRGTEGVALVAARPAERGVVADAAPVDGNFSELLVRAGELWLDPGPGGGAGGLPPRFLGTKHAVIGEDLTGPTDFPAATADDDRIERKAKLALSADGKLTGEAVWTAATGGAVTKPVDIPGWGRRDGGTMSYGVLPWRVLQELELSGAPPEGELDLGRPRVVVDEIAVDLPPGVTGAKLAAPADISAGPAGSYERTVTPEGRTVTVKRTFRLEITRFGPDEAEALFTWLRRIQAAERAETLLQLQ